MSLRQFIGDTMMQAQWAAFIDAMSWAYTLAHIPGQKPWTPADMANFVVKAQCPLYEALWSLIASIEDVEVRKNMNLKAIQCFPIQAATTLISLHSDTPLTIREAEESASKCALLQEEATRYADSLKAFHNADGDVLDRLLMNVVELLMAMSDLAEADYLILLAIDMDAAEKHGCTLCKSNITGVVSNFADRSWDTLRAAITAAAGLRALCKRALEDRTVDKRAAQAILEGRLSKHNMHQLLTGLHPVSPVVSSLERNARIECHVVKSLAGIIAMDIRALLAWREQTWDLPPTVKATQTCRFKWQTCRFEWEHAPCHRALRTWLRESLGERVADLPDEVLLPLCEWDSLLDIPEDAYQP